MCARYRMVRNPNPTGDKKKQALHPRVVPYGTISTEELMRDIEGRSGFSGADIKGALRVIADAMAFRLDEGYNVELDGLGFFSVSLVSRPVMDRKEIRSESVHFRNVNFRCGKYLKSKLKSISLERMPEGKGVLPSFDERSTKRNRRNVRRKRPPSRLTATPPRSRPMGWEFPPTPTVKFSSIRR